MSDPLIIAGQEFGSRLFLGTAGYPNRKIMLDAVEASGTAMVTASIRRISLAGDDESLIELLAGRVRFLPNTAGCTPPRTPSSPPSWRAKPSTPTGSSSKSSATASCFIPTSRNWCARPKRWSARALSCCLIAPRIR